MKFDRIDEDTYETTIEGRRVRIQRSWRRVGGWQWQADVLDGRLPACGPTRAACAAKVRRLLLREA